MPENEINYGSQEWQTCVKREMAEVVSEWFEMTVRAIVTVACLMVGTIVAMAAICAAGFAYIWALLHYTAITLIISAAACAVGIVICVVCAVFYAIYQTAAERCEERFYAAHPKPPTDPNLVQVDGVWINRGLANNEPVYEEGYP